jgi:hypothetical protein
MRDALRIIIGRDLDAFAREVELFPDDALLWKTIPGIANSAGNLGLHVAGNLQHFIGAVLGQSGYVRHRDLEFSRRDGTRAEVVDGLAKTREVVARTVTRLTDEDLAQPYGELLAGRRVRTGDFLLHLSSHLAFHLGQAGYLRRTLTGEMASSGALSHAVLPSI